MKFARLGAPPDACASRAARTCDASCRFSVDSVTTEYQAAGFTLSAIRLRRMTTRPAEADWHEEERAAWRDQWSPKCPIGNRQRVCACVGYREREPGRLQLRMIVHPLSEGVCEAIVVENDHEILVRVLVCYEEADEDNEDNEDNDDYMNCPVHVYLEKPLNGRPVIDVDSGEALPLFVPSFGRAPMPDPVTGADVAGVRKAGHSTPHPDGAAEEAQT